MAHTVYSTEYSAAGLRERGHRIYKFSDYSLQAFCSDTLSKTNMYDTAPYIVNCFTYRRKNLFNMLVALLCFSYDLNLYH